MAQQIHIVEDDVAFGKMLTSFLERKGFNVTVSLSGEKARKTISESNFDLLITDLKLPDDSGLDLLEFSQKTSPKTKVILMTGYAEVDTAVKAIKKGALDYISKPFRPEELLMIIEADSQNRESAEEHISETVEPKQPASQPSSEKSKFVIGISEASKKFNEYLKLVGPTDMCVLIQGESGTGKEVAAKAIHNYSSRKDKNFVAVDCGAIPKEIAASEFFGHVKGSFTGAVNDKKGHFEAADGGTLFLDEVGNLSYENQIQLLRALQERRIKPVGSNTEIDVDVRILSATNEDLLKAVSEGKFREDLYHRLNEFSIRIPSLHERKEDLFLFIEYFLNQANKSLGKEVIGLSKEVEEAFKNYAWPGNLRELKNVIKRSVLLTNSQLIPLEVIPREVLFSANTKKETVDFSKESNEKQLILNALKETDFNKTKAAKLLNITRKTLYNKLEHYQIEL
ncbi:MULTISPECIES: sigma-54-dependent transcriptional regulator [Aequorivita]|uniref:Sigma-54-dependent Fis family transcriptional regulator n=1 Tax=Aequorivita iocasae TaxID=2803865 RepID=A0ABX7DT79_9FLAO|nr:MULTISPECIES: sigma-54 dependent transcriptional regulator [Aequorivita]QQX77360.1 sigma-54-dependent Fis family transcriptional regulator [Aequorivita iocasae]UCA56849.1 sigma-54 dependent transcriptional regulator [Aequorivita sp. F7]